MSIMLDEAQAYENSRDYDCCQIVEGAYTVGDFGPSACFIDPNRFEEIARSVLQAARNAVGKDME